MDQVTTYGDISPRTAVKAAKRLLRIGQQKMMTQRFGMMDDQPQNSTRVRKWRRYHSFPLAKTPLTEGVTPAGHKLTYTDYVATLEQYGDLVTITDVIKDTHEDPVLRTAVDRSADQAARTIESVAIDVLKGGTNVYYASSVGSRALVAAPISRGDIRRIQRGFDRTLAEPISTIIKAGPDESTQGVEASFFAMGHTDLEPDIRNMTGFKTIVEYANVGQAVPHEIGAVDRTRFCLSAMWEPWDAAGANTTTLLSNGDAPAGSQPCDVYPIVIVAKDAYACVRLQGRQAVKIMVLNPDQPRGGDELGQRGSVSWKTYFTCVRLNEQWMARLEVGATANPS